MAGICDVPIISNVCDTVGESAATLVAAPFDWLAQAIGQAASWLFQGVWSLFDSTTLVDITTRSLVVTPARCQRALLRRIIQILSMDPSA